MSKLRYLLLDGNAAINGGGLSVLQKCKLDLVTLNRTGLDDAGLLQAASIPKMCIRDSNNWLSQDEENPRDPETDPITEEELARRISMTSLSVTSGGSFTAWFDCDEMFTDHAVTVYGSLKKGLKTANIEG